MARKDTRPSALRPPEPELAVTAHLCEVSRLEPPQESNRNPTWFSAEKAKQRLLDDRAPGFGAELARVVDRASSRIQRLHGSARHTPERLHKDALQEVRFEGRRDERLQAELREAALLRDFLRERRGARSSAAIEAAVQAHLREIRRPVLRLAAGAASTAETDHNITTIDSGLKANLSKPSR